MFVLHCYVMANFPIKLLACLHSSAPRTGVFMSCYLSSKSKRSVTNLTIDLTYIVVGNKQVRLCVY